MGRTGFRSNAEQRRPGWAPPGGGLVGAVVLFLLLYVVLLNVRSFGYSRDEAFPDPNRPPERWQAVLPNSNFAFGASLGIDQGWGLFAPRPGLYVGWYQAIGIQRDGSRIDLLHGGKPADDTAQSKPDFHAGDYANGRWRKMLMNLSLYDHTRGTEPPQSRAYPYLLPGLARYLYREWNEQHEGADALRTVEIIWWKEETRPPTVAPPAPKRIVLLRYEPDALKGKRFLYHRVDVKLQIVNGMGERVGLFRFDRQGALTFLREVGVDETIVIDAYNGENLVAMLASGGQGATYTVSGDRQTWLLGPAGDRPRK